ncbi:hypothetical protein H696_06017 [Fonticula alba]|uniref:SET domain-containing protein n=1 Tax=Fonticula alba TaxID=691883 RepID=A0A058Z1Y5_FONAL|nr:hypothetical protein H696_06017 [Fonticula alba]KCV67497.1 hypothetical protein H696_06017 [Fonticula alba]|eukprot:XP_009498058.1 hypothetical protein H696_06017 [Fonticula alba]
MTSILLSVVQHSRRSFLSGYPSLGPMSRLLGAYEREHLMGGAADPAPGPASGDPPPASPDLPAFMMQMHAQRVVLEQLARFIRHQDTLTSEQAAADHVAHFPGGFTVELDHSPVHGTGVFVRGFAPAGSVVTLHPGIVFTPSLFRTLQTMRPLMDPHCKLARADSLVIEASGYFPSRAFTPLGLENGQHPAAVASAMEHSAPGIDPVNDYIFGLFRRAGQALRGGPRKPEDVSYDGGLLATNHFPHLDGVYAPQNIPATPLGFGHFLNHPPAGAPGGPSVAPFTVNVPLRRTGANEATIRTLLTPPPAGVPMEAVVRSFQDIFALPPGTWLQHIPSRFLSSPHNDIFMIVEDLYLRSLLLRSKFRDRHNRPPGGQEISANLFTNPTIPTVAYVATRDLQDEEIFVDYALDVSSDLPDWYTPVSQEGEQAW